MIFAKVEVAELVLPLGTEVKEIELEEKFGKELGDELGDEICDVVETAKLLL